MSECSVCGATVTDELLGKRYIDPANPTKILGPWCPDCLPTIRVCNYCRDQTVEEGNNPHGYHKTSRLLLNGEWCCEECLGSLELCEGCECEGVLEVAPDGKKVCASCRAKYIKCDVCKGYHFKDSIVSEEKTFAEYAGIFRKYDTVCKGCLDTIKSRFKKYEVTECENCGKWHTNGGKYCPKCYNRLPTCDHCGEKTHSYSNYNVEGERVKLCHHCFPKVNQCSSCGGSTFNTKKVKGKYICLECLEGKTCKICHKNRKSLKDGVCDSCRKAYTDNICPDCGRIKDHDGRCRVCYRTQVYNYSLKPPIYFNQLEGESPSISFGIENEVSFSRRRDMETHLKNLYSNFDPSILVTKHDGSISGEGFEIVTQPMSIKFFNKFNVAGLFSRDMQASDSCGMHIHVSRDSFASEVHILKVTKFIYDHEDFVNKMVGRGYSGYNGKLKGKASSAILKMKKGSSGARSARINLTNAVTIEFRMFAGCTTVEEMRRRVEFLHALISWTRNTSLSSIYDSDNLVAYIRKNVKTYPTATKYYGV